MKILSIIMFGIKIFTKKNSVIRDVNTTAGFMREIKNKLESFIEEVGKKQFGVISKEGSDWYNIKYTFPETTFKILITYTTACLGDPQITPDDTPLNLNLIVEFQDYENQTEGEMKKQIEDFVNKLLQK